MQSDKQLGYCRSSLADLPSRCAIDIANQSANHGRGVGWHSTNYMFVYLQHCNGSCSKPARQPVRRSGFFITGVSVYVTESVNSVETSCGIEASTPCDCKIIVRRQTDFSACFYSSRRIHRANNCCQVQLCKYKILQLNSEKRKKNHMRAVESCNLDPFLAVIFVVSCLRFAMKLRAFIDLRACKLGTLKLF